LCSYAAVCSRGRIYVYSYACRMVHLGTCMHTGWCICVVVCVCMHAEGRIVVYSGACVSFRSAYVVFEGVYLCTSMRVFVL
jgi:hypothetical protein